VRSLTLVAVGDVLPHRRVKATAADLGWSGVLAGITPLVTAADVAFANLESPVAPDHHKGIHGEVFNAPASLLPGLAEAGFDVLAVANNHAYDQGADGLLETLQRVDAAGMVAVGAGSDCATAWSPRITEHDGLRIAWIASSDLTNIDGNTTDDAPCVAWAGPVCTGDCGPDRDAIHFSLDTERLVQLARRAAEQADLVVWSFHWGDEYRTVPLPEYPPLAHALTDAGVDVLLGHHPHVLQPIEQRTTARGTPAVIAYSLGNAVSDMGSRFDPEQHPVSKGHTRDGLALTVRAEWEGDALRSLAVDPVPLWTQNNRRTEPSAPPRVTVEPTEALPEPLRSQRIEAVRAVLGM
jgi:poly-gamma-glutamate synthesis protein (capsule biosynthesis protein)